MNKQRLLDLIEKHWEETTILMQRLIKLHPEYRNPEGLKAAASLISSYLVDAGLMPEVISYKNKEICQHPLYVPVESFSDDFRGDQDREKTNIICVVDGKASGKAPEKTIILNGHYDVDIVNTPEQWAKKDGWKSGDTRDGRLWGRGATDMLAGLCSFLLVAKIFHKTKEAWCGRIIINAVCDEEIGGNGTLKTILWMQENNLLPSKSCCLIAEPTARLICKESLGFIPIKIIFKRPSVHMGVAGKTNNAIYDMKHIIDTFPDMLLSYCYENSFQDSFSKMKYNWGCLRGGEDPAIPLGEVVLEGVLFFPEAIDVADLQEHLSKEIMRLFENTAVEFGALSFPGAASQGGDFLAKELANKNNFPDSYAVEKGLFPSPCDARLYHDFSIPVIVYGPGSLEQAHAVDEFIDINEVKKYTQHCLFSLSEVFCD